MAKKNIKFKMQTMQPMPNPVKSKVGKVEKKVTARKASASAVSKPLYNRLSKLVDTKFSTLANGDRVSWDTSINKWINIPGGGGGLDDFLSSAATAGASINLTMNSGTVVSVDLTSLVAGLDVAVVSGVVAGNNLTLTMTDASSIVVDVSSLTAAASNTSVMTDNANGTYAHNDGTGTIVTINTKPTYAYDAVVDAAGGADYLDPIAALVAGKKRIFVMSGVYNTAHTSQLLLSGADYHIHGAGEVLWNMDINFVIPTFQGAIKLNTVASPTSRYGIHIENIDFSLQVNNPGIQRIAPFSIDSAGVDPLLDYLKYDFCTFTILDNGNGAITLDLAAQSTDENERHNQYNACYFKYDAASTNLVGDVSIAATSNISIEDCSAVFSNNRTGDFRFLLTGSHEVINCGIRMYALGAAGGTLGSYIGLDTAINCDLRANKVVLGGAERGPLGTYIEILTSLNAAVSGLYDGADVPNTLTPRVTATAYVIGDYVSQQGSIYIATANHTSAANFFTDAASWDQVRFPVILGGNISGLKIQIPSAQRGVLLGNGSGISEVRSFSVEMNGIAIDGGKQHIITGADFGLSNIGMFQTGPTEALDVMVLGYRINMNGFNINYPVAAYTGNVRLLAGASKCIFSNSIVSGQLVPVLTDSGTLNVKANNIIATY